MHNNRIKRKKHKKDIEIFHFLFTKIALCMDCAFMPMDIWRKQLLITWFIYFTFMFDQNHTHRVTSVGPVDD